MANNITSVKTINELRTLNKRTNYEFTTVLVTDKDEGGIFTYDSARFGEDDGVDVIDGWVRSDGFGSVGGQLAGLQATAGEIDGAVNTVNGAHIEHTYDINFATLTSRAGANQIYMNNNPITVASKLDSVRVKSDIGSTITVYAYSISGSSGSYAFQLLYTYPPKTSTQVEEIFTFSDDFEIPLGAYIAVKSSSNFYFTSTAYPSKKVGASVDQNVILAFDFKTVSVNYSLTDTLSTMSSNISSISSSINNKLLKKCVLYKNSFNDLTGLEVVNWIASSNIASPSALGSTNYLWLKNKYHSDNIEFNITIKLHSDTVFTIASEPLTYNQGNGKIEINIPSKTITVYKGSTSYTLVGTANMTQTFVNGGDYKIILTKRNGLTTTINVINKNSGSIDSYTWNTSVSSLNDENRLMESLKIYQVSGASFIGVKNITISAPSEVYLYICGDSITEGVYFSSGNFQKKYSSLLKQAVRGDAVISARGGAVLADLTTKVATELQYIKPKYLIATIGTNGGITTQGLTDFIALVKSFGVDPIINHVPNRANGSHVATNNTIDAVCRATNTTIGALFDIPTSISNDPANSYVSSLYADAGVHPNELGHSAMFDRFAIDTPFLFDSLI